MKTLRKINLLITIIGATIFTIGTILQIVNMDPEAETSSVQGLNQLTYFGAIILSISLIIWLMIFGRYVFKDLRWLKSKTKVDDALVLFAFTFCIPFVFSLLTFILCDLMRWYEWYTELNYLPLYDLIFSQLDNLGNKLEFWVIFIILVSVSSGLAIFFYKTKSREIRAESQK